MDQHIGLLKQFVHAIKANTNLLHDPKLDFFREYIEGMGGTIPPRKCEPESSDAEENSTSGIPSEQNTSVEEEYPPIPYPEDIDNSGVIEADNDTDLPMGDDKKEPSDEDLNKASEERENAMVAFSNDNFDEAIAHYTTAIQHNPRSAMLFAKRASVLLKLKKPVAAIRDCDKAISINPDSSQGYKFRGRAHRLLGKWVEAHNDLAMACKLDYDDSTNEWLKEVEPNAKKLHDYNRAVARQAEERELKERLERVRKAKEANKKAEEEAKKFAGDATSDFHFGFGSGGNPSGGMGAMFNDPEIMEAMQDPEVMPAFLDIMNNPSNLMKYMGNPKVMKLIAKMKGMPEMFSGNSDEKRQSGCPSECDKKECGQNAAAGEAPYHTQPTGKAPEPDLD